MHNILEPCLVSQLAHALEGLERVVIKKEKRMLGLKKKKKGGALNAFILQNSHGQS